MKYKFQKLNVLAIYTNKKYFRMEFKYVIRNNNLPCA